MPNIRSQDRVKRSGEHTKNDILKIERPALARGELRGAYGGRENAAQPKGDNRKHSTNVKGRQTKESKYRTPKI